MTEKTLQIADDAPRPEGAEPDGGKFGAGDVLEGRYRLDVLLGEGGMGAVWRADHLRIHRAVAVKVLHPEISRSPLETERFRREAQIAVRLKSPYVVDVLDFGQTKAGALFLVMELLEGESLRERIRREGRMVPEEVGRLLRQLMRGLDAAHRAGIVHRDLKPENLWLVPDDGRLRLKILDFGIAKVAGSMAGTEKTQAGLVMGTPQYLSPEQAVGGDVDHRADLYSAGIIAYLMLTGRHPFPTSDARGLLRAHAFDPVPSPARELPELVAHPALLRFVSRACEKDRNLRAQSAAELLEVLEGRPGGAGARRTQSAPALPAQRTPSQATAISGLLRPVSSSAPRALNLTLLLTELADWAALRASRGREEVATLLTEHDHLVLPAIRAYHGRRIKSKDDALVAAFPSPTNAVLCAMAIQDRLAQRNLTAAGDRLALRIAVHLGETREEKGDLVGEPLAVAGAVRRLAEPGEIRVTRSVYLAMSRGEVRLEPLPPLDLGQGHEALPLYRVERQGGPFPYGGREAARVEASERVTRAIAPITDGLSSIGDAAAEGRIRATLRVAWAALALGVLRATDLLLLAVRGLLVVFRWFGWSHRPPPLWLNRLVFGTEHARELLRARWPVHRAALIRPL